MKWIKIKLLVLQVLVVSLGSNPVYANKEANEGVFRQEGLVKIKNVKCIKQFPELPTGCEATTLTMLLNYHGVKVSKEEVASSMPKCDVPYYKNGKRYGYHPSQAFIGSPYSVHSYGVFSEVIVKMLEYYCPKQVEDLKGKSLDELLKNIEEGRPVMIWATIGMSQVSYKNSWIIDSKGTIFRWPGNEHALLLVGYDKYYLYLNDPYTGKEQRYKRSLVEKRYNDLGKQAVSLNFAPSFLYEEKVIKEEQTQLERETEGDSQKEQSSSVCQINEMVYWTKQIIKEMKRSYDDNSVMK
ncbi:hypothetical protein CS063_00590 [Sporanaerobium hydrogeniformans]|uniref:Uncharacterized protein n=1 Tax=Sporanaerobium hydrogeniformans TaxID=3072179 RepID=A0AC61DHN0_9FIRM|nr:C39 family peptidase [Sporanaerobium hydrogeniformans]PHV72007.1 hypothetical protein CS063_00590 [Sporanaerobium hydrogeniformans]